ncbi:hypothetical protein [Metabacillus halosaccharovorans]|uniref:hypothetical protein n=1 Tax=Metabacillus halosaccharovorans TaxID=930124 RepID=UPI00203E8650|nr:hypothetical protein [Metabacillus halosaccharovorans]MCM3439362.1 hypothetical protein [Metabacillus halosaccharovorans]
MDTLEERLNQKIEECNRLKDENRKLKELLKQHNIKVDVDSLPNIGPNSKLEKIQERIGMFKKLFKGREDVYASTTR